MGTNKTVKESFNCKFWISLDKIQIHFIVSRLEKVLQSDEAKTFLGDVLGAGNSSNMAEGEIAMMPNLTESDNIMTTAPITQGVEQNTSEPYESISQKNNANTDDIQTSSSESDVDKKVNLINFEYVNM